MKIIIRNTFTESPAWMKNKSSAINPLNNENKCFQYSIIISLFHKEIKKNPEIISKIKPFINNLDRENINFPPEEQDYQQFEMNNKSIALNILRKGNQGEITHCYKCVFNKTRKKQVILLMITDDECETFPQKQHYLAVKKLNALLKKRQFIVGNVVLTV